MQTDSPSEYPQTYRRGDALRYGMIGLLVVFAAYSGAITAAVHGFGILQGRFDVRHAVICVVILAFGFCAVAVTSERVILYSNGIEVVGWFSRQKLMREEIRGYRIGRIRGRAGTVPYFILVPLDQNGEELALPEWLHFQRLFMKFISDIPPLEE
jgi:hypothetical protein